MVTKWHPHQKTSPWWPVKGQNMQKKWHKNVHIHAYQWAANLGTSSNTHMSHMSLYVSYISYVILSIVAIEVTKCNHHHLDHINPFTEFDNHPSSSFRVVLFTQTHTCTHRHTMEKTIPSAWLHSSQGNERMRDLGLL